MANERSEPRRSSDRPFENEPADEWTPAYGRGGPVRSDEPERDYFFESNAAPNPTRVSDEQVRRMSWRAEGVQDYPGGALDQLIQASHRGKGPKGYRRSDERLRECICERLTDDPFVDATDIDVAVADGEATLSGSVDSRQMKFTAEEIAEHVPGVTTVHNSIRVRR